MLKKLIIGFTYDLIYIWCLYWKQTKLSDLPVLIWFVIHLMSILKTNKTIWFTCPYMICFTSDVYTENKQNYLIYLSLYDLLYIWGLYWKQICTMKTGEQKSDNWSNQNKQAKKKHLKKIHSFNNEMNWPLSTRYDVDIYSTIEPGTTI